MFTYDAGTVWSPDSRQLAFTRVPDLYVINSSGGTATRLTDDAVMDFAGDWR